MDDTPTPRTDDEEFTPQWTGIGTEPGPVVSVEFARQLERENLQLKARLERIQQIGEVFVPPARWDSAGAGGGFTLDDCERVDLSQIE